jgi:hypothetical protein
MKDVHAFLAEDRAGHLAMSQGELEQNADWNNELTAEQRQKYFYGIVTVFPVMLLSHYYEWLTGKDTTAYMEEFAPANEKKFAPQTTAMLETIYAAPESKETWIAAVSSYLATVPYGILREFTAWTKLGTSEKLDAFVRQEYATVLPQLVDRVAACTTIEERIKAVVYFGGHFPFEVVERYHNQVVAD